MPRHMPEFVLSESAIARYRYWIDAASNDRELSLTVDLLAIVMDEGIVAFHDRDMLDKLIEQRRAAMFKEAELSQQHSAQNQADMFRADDVAQPHSEHQPGWRERFRRWFSLTE